MTDSACLSCPETISQRNSDWVDCSGPVAAGHQAGVALLFPNLTL